MLFAYFRIASEAQEEVRKHTRLITEILLDGIEADGICDAIYDPLVGSSKKDYEELLSKMGITIEWKPAENKFAKQERQEAKHNA